MRRWRWRCMGAVVACAAGLGVSRESSADEAATRAAVALETRFGAARAPFSSPSFPFVAGHGIVLTPSVRYRADEAFDLGLFVPVALMSVEQPAGSYVDEAAWCNPSLVVTRTWARPLGVGRSLRWFARLGLAIPLAEHGAPGAWQANRALALANALSGWRDQESFLPGRLSVTPSAGVELVVDRWQVEGSLKMPLAFEVSDADPSGADVHAVGFMPVVHVGGHVGIARWLILGLDTDLVVNVVAPVAPARGTPGAVQFVLRPTVDVPLGRHVDVSLDFVAPVAGPLGGSTFSGALSVMVRW